MKKKTIEKNTGLMVWGVIIFGIVGAVGYSIYASNQPGIHDAFAQCLEESGTKFYGAFWCPACKDQKQEFGNSEKLLPYVECSTPDRKSVTQPCLEAQIASYPTWDFPDGSRLTGALPLETLAEKSGCTLN